MASPVATRIDVDVAKALYMQGVPMPDIAAKVGCKVGTLRAYRKRYGWAIHKAKAQELGSPNTKANAETINEIGEEVKLLLAKDLRNQAYLLDKHPAITLKELPGKNGRTATTGSLAQASAKVFGWDAQSGKPMIQIGTINQLKLEATDQSSNIVAKSGDDNGQVIDIQGNDQ